MHTRTAPNFPAARHLPSRCQWPPPAPRRPRRPAGERTRTQLLSGAAGSAATGTTGRDTRVRRAGTATARRSRSDTRRVVPGGGARRGRNARFPGVRLPPPAAPRRSRSPPRYLRQERTTSSHTTVSRSADEDPVFRGPAVGRPHAALRPRRCGCPAMTSGAHVTQPRDRRARTAAAHPGIPTVRITTSKSGLHHARTAEGDRDPPLGHRPNRYCADRRSA